MPIRILNQPSHPWGDYGDILLQGMADDRGGRAEDGGLNLQRTGPFVPPITFPGMSVIVLTDAFRHQVELAQFRGVTFRPVHKSRIVPLAWHEWSQDAPEPAEFPETGEPEDYVLRGDHDPALADSIGPLWEVVLQPGVTVRRETGPSGVAVSIKVLADTWNGADIFLATGVGYIYASDRAHDWFLSTVPRWVAFEDCLFG